MPEELVDKKSNAWNKGRIHYTSAPCEVANAYAVQFGKDMEVFLNARAKEIVSGGLMVLILPSLPDGVDHSQITAGVMFDLLGSSLMDMAKEVRYQTFSACFVNILLSLLVALFTCFS